MVLEVVGGALVGELLKSVLDAKQKSFTFQHALARLESTLKAVIPRLDQISRLLNPQQPAEMAELVRLIMDGMAIVVKCSKIPPMNFVKRVHYSKKLVELDNSLLRYFMPILPPDHSKEIVMVSSSSEGGGGDSGIMERVCLQVRNSYPSLLTLQEFLHPGPDLNKWYLIDRDDAPAVEIRDMSHYFKRFTASASANSTVYVFGGRSLQICENPIVSDLWYTDTSYMDDDDDDGRFTTYAARGWIKGASMHHPRSRSCSVVVDGKIYVFGGVRMPTYLTWAEVYDIASNRWSLLVPTIPDMILPNICKCVAVVNSGLILVYAPDNESLYSYDVILGNWELFDSNFGLFESEPIVVVSVSSCGSSSVLFTIKEGLLYGYHIGLRKWFDDPVSGLEGNDALPDPDFLKYVRDIHLVRLGYRSNLEKLCVLWSFYPTDRSGLCVHCTKLSVYQEEDGQSSLAAKVESTNTFKLDDGAELISCLALATRQERKRAGESLYMEEEEGGKKNKY